VRSNCLPTALCGFALALPLALAGTAGRADDKPAAGPSLRSKQQALFDRINLKEAWEVTRGDPDVLVGVIDNGFDFFHPDLKGQVLPGYYYPGGYHTETYENIAHGTLVAGLIVARGPDPDGMAGLAPRCRVLTASQGMIEHDLFRMQRKFFEDHPKASLADFQKELAAHKEEIAKFGRDWVHYQIANAADAVRYLADHGVRVINVSGAFKRSLCPSAEDWQKLEDAFAYAAGKKVVIVLAAGNNAEEWDDYPGSPDRVIVAGASLLSGARWEEEITVHGTKMKQGSCYGKRLTVMAPVEKLVGCVPHDPRMYETKDGPMGPMKVPFQGDHEVAPNGATSSAAPIVSALAALVVSARPDLDARAVVEIIKKGADPLATETPDLHTGYGRVNFGKTVRLAQGSGKK
jgi:subtilisin family serine protease